MRNENVVQFIMEGVTLRKRNFAGKKTELNPAGGIRTFLVLLDEDTAETMAKEDWVVRRFKDDEDGNVGAPFLPVKVQFGEYPPQIYLETENSRKPRTLLDEETVGLLDKADIVNCDLIVNQSAWAVGGKTGIKTYLKSMYIIIASDYLARKYEEIDETRNRSQPNEDD